MAVIDGKMLTCDVCGKSVFIKYTDSCLDTRYGGYGSYERYEQPQEGWGCIPIVHDDIRQVCPTCAEPLNRLRELQEKEIEAVEKKWADCIKAEVEKMRKKKE